MPTYTYTVDDLYELEVAARRARPNKLKRVLKHVTKVLKKKSIGYGVLGGMNFYLRGSGRETSDIDIAVDKTLRTEELIEALSESETVHKPASKMQWAGGVARIFFEVDEQLVQVDLMLHGIEGHQIPRNISGSVDILPVQIGSNSFACNVLAIGPLVTTKINAHCERRENKDYTDLTFVCTSPKYADKVRNASQNFEDKWKSAFLEKVIEENPEYEQAIRWALGEDLESGSAGEGQSSSGASSGRGSGNKDKGKGKEKYKGKESQSKSSKTTKAGQSSSSGTTPRDGEVSRDGYWTYSAKYNDWYHVHRNGKYTWGSMQKG